MPSSQSTPPDTGYAQLAYGCQILMHAETRWPLHASIRHQEETCECESTGGERGLVRDCLLFVAYEYYYKRDPERYNALVCNDMIKVEAERLGLDTDELEIWDLYPQCLPARPARDGKSEA
ncbi:hypothetical protein GGS24DRAFT_506864 [Hypoxylon argillaceum]|nr:hypothetical protein GGS24DRAFT_506864 [Hypoxylon argillaceum]KAI1147543.1 hypothetical protein F4825DRAFT_471262 [Nemania diffusa]